MSDREVEGSSASERGVDDTASLPSPDDRQAPRGTVDEPRGPATAPPEARAFVAMGGNIGDRLGTLRSAARALAAGAVAGTRVVGTSGVYETRPVGPSTGTFFNAVVELRTRSSPWDLLEGLLRIEAAHGRQRRRRWDARTLDLDLLLYQCWTAAGWEAVEVQRDGLCVPHPEMTERDFVLVPLGDLVGDEGIVRGRAPRAWAAELGGQDRTILRRVSGPWAEAGD